MLLRLRVSEEDIPRKTNISVMGYKFLYLLLHTVRTKILRTLHFFLKALFPHSPRRSAWSFRKFFYKIEKREGRA